MKIYSDITNLLELTTIPSLACRSFYTCEECDIKDICLNMSNKKIYIKNKNTNAEKFLLDLPRTFLEFKIRY